MFGDFNLDRIFMSLNNKIIKPEPRRPGKPKTDAKARERILSSALELFCQAGFDGTSISAIARKAGVAQPIIYYYFDDKLALWKESVAGTFHELTEKFVDTELLDDLNPIDQLKVYARRAVRSIFDNKYAHQIIVTECADPGERLNYLVDTFFEPAHNAMLKLIEAARSTTAPRAEFILFQFLGTANFFIPQRDMINRLHKFDPKKTLGEYEEFVVRQLLLTLDS